ncbi:MAG: hypothetical protein IJB52_07945, partial [Clostridia bacterium]|nr:hypothetical protein [Clostridia bacterium]
PKPAQLRGEGWEVSEGRGGGVTRHLSVNLPPPLSSESRPEGHPYDGHRTNQTAVSNTNIKIPLLKASYQLNRCKQKKKKNRNPTKSEVPVFLKTASKNYFAVIPSMMILK